jgi:hypothetical protein
LEKEDKNINSVDESNAQILQDLEENQNNNSNNNNIN